MATFSLEPSDYDKVCCQLASDSIFDAFSKLDVKSGKPCVRSNGAKEWTVMAGIAAIDARTEERNPSVIPICLATGVKVLPDKVREYSNGYLVHDMHAEILALRAFNKFLIEECSKIHKRDEYSEKGIIENVEGSAGSFRLKDGIKLALVVTEPPCGDASISYLESSISSGSIPWEESASRCKKRKLEEKVSSVLKNSSSLMNRGRSGFGSVGVVRTKPGRRDSELSLSKSCSDKICLKQFTGITNCITGLLFPENIYLDYLFLPSKKANPQDVSRCFRERLQTNFNIRQIKVIEYADSIYQFNKPASSEKEKYAPSNLSLIAILPLNLTQVLNNGVRDGCYRKHAPPKRGGESFLCNQKMYQSASDLLDITSRSYIELKQENRDRQIAKNAGREALQGWICTGNDDFSLH